ncbi:MAG: T9SS type A sorting domain-containing protein [bacterium]
MDVRFTKTDSLGNPLWTKTIGGTAYDEGYSVQQTKDGGYILAGMTKSFGVGSGDIYLIRLGKETGIEEPSILDFGLGNADLKIIKDKIYLEVPKSINANVKIYDLCGREKEIVYNGTLSKGNYTFTPEIKKNGVYFVRVNAGTLKTTKKITIIR